jgi:zinc transport system substrate-binding protein
MTALPLPAALGLALLAAAPAVAAPRVAVDVVPIHSLVAAVMEGVGTPDLILPPGASPHGHTLRPSEARAVADADLTVWVGTALTPWLAHPLESLGGEAPQLELMEVPDMTLLPVRSGAAFEPHHHDGEEEHEEHSHDEHEAHEAVDAHIWLDPANATRIAAAVASKLAEIDPGNAALYQANAAAVAQRNAALTADLSATLAPMRGKGFLVFHDAYQYFERAFDLPAAGSISTTDGEAPSPGRVSALRARVLDNQIVCIFTEPQFEPKLVGTLVEGTPLRVGALDPEGTGLPLGPDLYQALMTDLAGALAGCLKG